MNPISYLKQYRKYRCFIKQYLKLTGKTYHNINELREFQSEDAIFIAGGDQIWNSYHPCGRDDAYKLQFINGKAKMAYGTSMGRNTFKEDELSLLAKKINDFISIGLREQSTVKMFQPYTSKNVYHAADPVMLLTQKDYMRFIGGERLIKEPYLLMYLADSSDLLNQIVEFIARRRGLKVVHVCGFKKKCNCDYFLKSTGPEDLLNLLYYSDFVISASFHATIFSILLHKQFCTLLPEEGTNTRIEDALSFFGLEKRIMRNVNDLKYLEYDIDFDKADEIRQRFVSASKDILLSALRTQI